MQKHDHGQLKSIWYIFIYSLIFIYNHRTLVDPLQAISNCTALYRLIIQKKKSKNATSIITRTVSLGCAISAAQRRLDTMTMNE